MLYFWGAYGINGAIHVNQIVKGAYAKKNNHGGKRPGAGAKKKAIDEKRVTCSFCIAPSYKAMIEDLAKEQGISQSDVLNDILYDAALKYLLQ